MAASPYQEMPSPHGDGISPRTWLQLRALPLAQRDDTIGEVMVQDILRFHVGWLVFSGVTTVLYLSIAGIIYYRMEQDRELYLGQFQGVDVMDDETQTDYFHRAGLCLLLPGALAWFVLGVIVPCLVRHACTGDAFKKMCRGLRTDKPDWVFEEARAFESISGTPFKTVAWFDIMVNPSTRCGHLSPMKICSVSSFTIVCVLGPAMATLYPEWALKLRVLPFGLVGLVGSLMPALLGLLALTHVCLGRIMVLIRRMLPDVDEHWAGDGSLDLRRITGHENAQDKAFEKDHWKNMLHDVIVLDRDLDNFWAASNAGAAWITALGSLAALMTFSALFLIDAWDWRRQIVGVVSTATCGAMFLYGLGALSNVTAAVRSTRSTSVSLRNVLSSWIGDMENSDRMLIHGRLLEYLAIHDMGAALGGKLITRDLVSEVLFKFAFNVPILITIGKKLMHSGGK